MRKSLVYVRVSIHVKLQGSILDDGGWLQYTLKNEDFEATDGGWMEDDLIFLFKWVLFRFQPLIFGGISMSGNVIAVRQCF